MEFTVQQIADMLGGTVEGNPAPQVSTLAKIEEAGEKAWPFYRTRNTNPYLYTTQASAIIVAKDLELKQHVEASLIRVTDPYSSFSKLLEEYQKAVMAFKTGVEEPAFMAQNSTIGDNFYRGCIFLHWPELQDRR
jgi:UDP-3-O-[3-hydroxymyristoyl] glucosamine N-acyltransferase